jgi:hypothetical protein
MTDARHDDAAEPRETLGRLLHAASSLSEDALERIHALEDGRHPAIDDLRDALGRSLDLDIAVNAGLAALDDGGQTPPSATSAHIPIAAALDAAYRALSSPRLVRAEITPAAIHCWRDPAPIVLTEDEPLVLVVLADNRTDATVEFSAESHGEGFGGFVEAQRTGSSMLSLGAMPAGKYLVPLLVVADGRAHTLDLPIECSAKR